jgi:hypothetical protein
MAIVGPVTSFVLGIFFLILGTALAGAAEFDPSRPWDFLAQHSPS